MGDITFEKLVGLLAGALVLIGAYNTIMTAIKTHREEKKRKDAPVNTLEEQVKQHEAKLKKDHERLTEMEEAIRILMRSQIAQLDHEISGNSVDKLRISRDEIQKFLIEK